MASRRITKLKMGQEIKYFDKNYIVMDVYPYIAYLKKANDEFAETICVNLGDLVMAGVEPSMIDFKAEKRSAS